MITFNRMTEGGEAIACLQVREVDNMVEVVGHNKIQFNATYVDGSNRPCVVLGLAEDRPSYQVKVLVRFADGSHATYSQHHFIMSFRLAEGAA
jgi:hypothetical protein